MAERYVTLTELSEIAGKNKSTLHYHKRKKRIKPVDRMVDGQKRKLYPLNETLKILAKYNDSSRNPEAPRYSDIEIPGVELYNDDSDLDAGDIDAEKLRKMKNQNELMEMEIQKRKGETLVASEVHDKQGEVAIAVKTNIMAMCDRIAPALVGIDDIAEVSRLLRTESKNALSAISKWILSDERLCESCKKKIVG